MSGVDLVEISTFGNLNETIKEMDDRHRFQVVFWILNQLKYMHVPSHQGWSRTADRLRGISVDAIESEAVAFFKPNFNKQSIRGWQTLICAIVGLRAGMQYLLDHCDKALERLIDNAHSDKNKGSIEKWEYVEKIIMKEALVSQLDAFLKHMDVAINKKRAPSSAMRYLEELPYGPQAETWAQKQERERKYKEALAKDDDDGWL